MSICQVFLSKVYSQRVKITLRGNAENEPKAGPEVKVKESASYHLFENHQFLPYDHGFLMQKCSEIDLGSSSKNRQIFKFSLFFRHFFHTFPHRLQSSCGPIEPILSQLSSKTVFKVFSRICQSVKYFYQKHLVKGSKLRISAGTPKISRRPVQR